MYRISWDSKEQPPALAERLLLLFSPADAGEALAGDLAEEYWRHHLPILGRGGAYRWYWSQVLRSLLPGLSRPARRRKEDPAFDPTTPGSHSPEPGPPALKNRIRARKGDGLMNDLLQDVRFAFRTLKQSPTFSVVTVLTLALAIGVNCAIFSILNLIFLSDMVPIREGETLGFVFVRNPERGIERRDLS